MAKKELGRMSDEEYKALSPEQLMQYNKILPEIDYEHPYQHQEYPRVMYQLVIEPDSGAKRMRTALVKNERELNALGDGWKKSTKEWGVETSPSAPAIQIDDSFDVALTPKPPEPVVYEPVKGERQTLHVPAKKDAAART